MKAKEIDEKFDNGEDVLEYFDILKAQKVNSKIPEKIFELINDLIIYLEKNQIHILEAFLFGSYANGTFNEFSDIDLALISEDFEGIRFNDNMKLMRSILNISSDFETHPFRPKDFTPENPFVEEILKKGIRVY